MTVSVPRTVLRITFGIFLFWGYSYLSMYHIHFHRLAGQIWKTMSLKVLIAWSSSTLNCNCQSLLYLRRQWLIPQPRSSWHSVFMIFIPFIWRFLWGCAFIRTKEKNEDCHAVGPELKGAPPGHKFYYMLWNCGDIGMKGGVLHELISMKRREIQLVQAHPRQINSMSP